MTKFKYYNANINNSDINDCARRALSLAFNLPYQTIEEELVHIRNDLGKRYYNSPEVINKFITDHGAIEIPTARRMVVGNFCEKYNIGTYLLEVYKIGEPSHITCLIDNTIYDTWDCLNWNIIRAYQVSDEISLLNVNFKLSDYKHFIEIETKNILKEYIKEYLPQAKFDFVAADYFDDTTERVRYSINLKDYNIKNYNDSFLIKISYWDNEVEDTIKSIVQLNCLKIIKKLTKWINK